MKKAALYVRVSTQEQKKHGLSVDNQIDALQNYAKEHNYLIAGVYNDAGISARKKYTNRPALLELLQDVQENKIDIILFTKLDRWFRSVADYYDVQKVLDANRIPWRAIWEDYETETSNGAFKVNIMLSVAQQEADRTGERIRSVLEYKKSRGEYMGGVPTGYKIDNKKLVKDPEKEEAINALFQTFLKTLSVRTAAEAANALGEKHTVTIYYYMLRNPAYAGTPEGGGTCEAYITPEEHELIVNRLRTRVRTPKEENRFYMFSGLVYCAKCGRRMVATANDNYLKGEVVHRYSLYRCMPDPANPVPHKFISISENKLEKLLLSEVEEQLNEYIVTATKRNADIKRTAEAKRKKAIEKRLARLAVLFEEGDISIDNYRKKRDALRQELTTIDAEPIPIPPALPTDWETTYHGLTPEYKRRFWCQTIKRVTFDKNEKTPHISIEFN